MPCYHSVLLTQILPPTISSVVIFNRQAEKSHHLLSFAHLSLDSEDAAVRRWSMIGGSVHYEDNPKRSFGCFADSGKSWPDLLVHAAGELWGGDWADMLTTRGSVDTTSRSLSLSEGSHQVLAPFQSCEVALGRREWQQWRGCGPCSLPNVLNLCCLGTTS